VLETVRISGASLAFSADVLADGLKTTAEMSAELTLAGVEFSADTTVFIARAASAGIHLSADTAEIFLTQAVNIAAASGRLSGESAKLAAAMAKAGVELSADAAILVANAGRAGIHISEETARRFIAASLDIADECIQSTVIAERYVVMTLAEANALLKEASLATVRAGIRGGRQVYTFTARTAGYLNDLGIDSAKYAKELTVQAFDATTDAVIHSVRGANDAVVVVINTGSGLVVATMDSLTASIEDTTNKIR